VPSTFAHTFHLISRLSLVITFTVPRTTLQSNSACLHHPNGEIILKNHSEYSKTGGTGVAEFLHKGPKVGPDIFLSDYCEGFVLSGVPREDVIMFVLEDLESEVVCVWDVNLIMVAE
jgi:hypothetical protein